jgi:hypothetical protein
MDAKPRSHSYGPKRRKCKGKVEIPSMVSYFLSKIKNKIIMLF